jgi:hypothetical protein
MIKNSLVMAMAIALASSFAGADSLNVRTVGTYATGEAVRAAAYRPDLINLVDGGQWVLLYLDQGINPTYSGSCDSNTLFMDVAYPGGMVSYLADYYYGLRTVGIVTHWISKATPTRGNPNAISVSGNYAYIADGDSGLSVMDISSPSAPSLAGYCNTQSYAYDLALSDTFPYVYLANGDSGLRIINISVPATPGSVGCYLTAGAAQGVACSEPYIYVAAAGAGLRILSLNGGLHEEGYLDLPGWAYRIAAYGNYVYVADWYDLTAGSVWVVDVSNPANPTLAGYYSIPSCAVLNVDVHGSYIYLSTDFGLRILQFPIPPVIDLNPASYDFGVVSQGDSASWSGLYLKNIGSLDLDIDSLKAGTASFSTQLPADTLLAPGESLAVLLWFKPASGGAITDTLRIFSNDAEHSPAKVALSGIGMTVIDVPFGSVPRFEGSYEPGEWTDAHKNTFDLEDKIKYHNVDTFWVKYNGDTLYLLVMTPDFAGFDITDHSLMFDTKFDRTAEVQSDDFRFMVNYKAEPLQFEGDGNGWNGVMPDPWPWTWGFSDATHLLTYFAVPFSLLGIEPGTPDSVGFTIMADGSRGIYGRWPAGSDSVSPVTWATMTSSAGWTGIAGTPETRLLPGKFAVSRIYPNPSRGSVEIEYQLPKTSDVTMQVHNIAGQLVGSICAGVKPAGRHSIEWNGSGLPNGVYICRLQAGAFQATRKITLLR